MGLNRLPDANFVLISTPGEYAAAEALKAMRLGLHVMVFSDNVSLEDEIELKRFGRDHGLMMMGPDCGTAIINGVPLGFANVVRSGEIGVIGASGTGLQEVTSLIDRLGGGISQAVGTGGRDLHNEVGGMTMVQALKALEADEATRVLVLISKPPSPSVTEKVLDEAKKAKKPVVVNLLGADPGSVRGKNLFFADTLEAAALKAVALSKNGKVDESTRATPIEKRLVDEAKNGLASGRRYIRGLFSGGTFCYEALLLLSEALGDVHSNLSLNKDLVLPDVWRSREHTVVDLGEDEFTRGRPHPMIDHRLRNERILQEAEDEEVGVILLDVVLGYGSHANPASEMVPVIRKVKEKTGASGPAFVASICGTNRDPQKLDDQEKQLREAGVILARSNAHAVRTAAAVVAGRST
jgi:FdrA protein